MFTSPRPIRDPAPSHLPPDSAESANIPIYFIAIANSMPGETGWTDLYGITTNEKVAESCPAVWKWVQDNFTRTQIESVIKNCNDKREETGGWNAEKGASQNLLDACIRASKEGNLATYH